MIASRKFVSSLVRSTLLTSLDPSNAIAFFARASRRLIIRYHHCHDFCAFAYVFACVFLCMFVCMLFSLLSPLLSPSCIFCVSDRASEKDCVRRGLLGARRRQAASLCTCWCALRRRRQHCKVPLPLSFLFSFLHFICSSVRGEDVKRIEEGRAREKKRGEDVSGRQRRSGEEWRGENVRRG